MPLRRMRRAVLISGVFLILVGAASFAFGIWYAWIQGVSTDISAWNLLSPAFGTDLLSLLALSASIMALGLVFIVWACRLKNEKNA